MNQAECHRLVEGVVLSVHRRNGGNLTELDGTLRLLDARLLLDSLDLAEIMVALERESGVSPFDAEPAPRNWSEVVMALVGGKNCPDLPKRS
jgi:acyl carrier protein